MREAPDLFEQDKRLAPDLFEQDAHGEARPTPSWWDVLSAVPQTAYQGARRGVGGVMQALGETTYGGTVRQTLPALLPALAPVAEHLRGPAIAEAPYSPALAESGRRTAQEAAQAQREATPAGMTRGQRAVLGGVSSAAQMAPGIVGSVALRNPVPALASAAALSGGSAYAQGREGGLDSEQARRYALANATAETALEAAPVGALLRPGVGLLSRGASFMVREIPTEMATTTAQMGLERGYDLRGPIGGQEYLQALGDTALQTMVGGPLQVGAAQLAHGMLGQPAPAQPTMPLPQPAVTPQTAPEAATGAPVAQPQPQDAGIPITPLNPPPDAAALTAPAEPVGEREQVGVNVEKLNTPESVKDFVVNSARTYSDRIDKARRGTMKIDETFELADMVGEHPKELLDRAPGQAFNAEQLRAAKQLLVDSASSVQQLASKAVNGGDQEIVAFQEAMARHVMIQETFAGARAEAGRALRILRETVDVQRQLGDLSTVFEAMHGPQGGRTGLQQAAKIIATAAKTPQAVGKAVQEIQKPGFRDRVFTVWINLLLSGPQTHVVNALSNAVTSAWTVPEQGLAGAIGALRMGVRPAAERGGDRVYMREATAKAWGAVRGMGDALRAAADTFVFKEPPDTLSKIEQPSDEITGNKFIDTFLTLPSHALETSDAFFKTIGYRMELNALAMRQGLAQGLKGDNLAAHVRDTLQNPPDDLKAESIEAGRYVTFTQQLGKSGRALQELRRQTTGLSVVVPFLRTPINIAKFALARTPAALVMRETFWKPVQKGGAARDLALARLTMGSAVGAWVASLAAEGLVTGGGPDEREARRVWLQNHQPYSVRIGDRWVSYGRMEPLGMIMGLAADSTEIMGFMEDSESENLAAVVAGALARNLMSKTFLRGLADMANALSDPERYGGRWFESLAGTVIPTGVAQVARYMDPTLRDTGAYGEDVDPLVATARQAINRIKSRIPGMGADLPPRRDIFGEPIVFEPGIGPDLLSPIYQKTANDPLAAELWRLKVRPGTPTKTIGGVKLTPQQYDRYSAISGQLARRILESMVNSPNWERLPDTMRAEMMRDAFSKGRAAARRILLQENPDLLRTTVRKKLEQVR